MKEDLPPIHDRERPGGRRAPAARGVPCFAEEERAQVEERLVYIAQRRYRFRSGVAEELARSTVTEYLEACGRYSSWVDHRTHLINLLRGKCREHIRRQIALTAQGNAIRDAMPGIQVPKAQEADALDAIAAQDARRRIFEALLGLRPKALDALESLRDGASRIELLDVIERMGRHKRADEPGVRDYRSQLRHILARCGIRI